MGERRVRSLNLLNEKYLHKILSMLNSDQLWPVFVKNAKIYFEKFEIFVSPKEESPYQITTAEDNKVKVTRSSGTSETITHRKFSTAIERLNAFYPRIPKNTLYDHVVEETTIVELLPNLDWDEHHDFIIAESYIVPQVSASPEVPLKTRYAEVAVRQGQPKLREKLLYLYEGRCAITGIDIKSVLHACHIKPYYQTKICLAEDAILLRSDLHDLFDSDCLAIHPETLEIHIRRNILCDDYRKLNGMKVRPRRDGGSILPAGLLTRWEAFQKNKKGPYNRGY